MADENLRPFATDRQWEYVAAVEECGSKRAAASALGVHVRTLQRSLDSLKKKAAQGGYSPAHDMTHTAPDGFSVKGVSTLYNQDGEVSAQWVKTNADLERREQIFREAVDALAEEVPRVLPRKADKIERRAALLNLYTITDFHMGMLAWHQEGGADWDLKIAQRVLLGCFEQMVLAAPPARACVISQLGDFLHSDGIIPITPTSGHVLDQDGRFSKIVGATIQCLRHLVDLALEKHESVHIIMAEGNHDITSSIWLRQMFTALYENEPRVTVDDSVIPYYAHQHGETALFFHHGHLKNLPQLPGLFAAQFPEIWGATKHRYGHTGHKHHTKVRETSEDAGVEIRQHPTLAARDAYAARGGWFAGRRAIGITYHDKHGEVGSNRVTPEMLDA